MLARERLMIFATWVRLIWMRLNYWHYRGVACVIGGVSPTTLRLVRRAIRS